MDTRDGRKRVLGYSYHAEGHGITFVERSADRSEVKVLGRAKGRPCRGEKDGPAYRDRPLCGRLRFTPGAGHAGTRRIYAVSSNGGVAHNERLVTTYRTAGDPRPRRPRDLRLRRRGKTVIVTWRSPAGHRHDDVRVVVGTGHTALHIHRGARNRVVLGGIHGHHRRMRVRVTVISRDKRLRPSRPAHATLGRFQERSSGPRSAPGR